MNAKNPINATAIILVVIGAINWGLVGLFEFNLVDALFGEGSGLARVIYALVGLAGLYLLAPFIGDLMRSGERSDHDSAVDSRARL